MGDKPNLPHFRSLVANQYVAAERRTVNTDPSDTRKALCETSIATPWIVDAAADAALAAAGRWSRSSQGYRVGLVAELLDLVESRRDELSLAVSREMGKPMREAGAEIDRSLAVGRYQLEHFDSLGSLPNSPPQGRLSFELREPLGVVAAITPWNFPVATVLRKVIPTLLAGNTVILKPSESSPLSARLICELFRASAIPHGVFGCLAGGGEVGRLLVAHAGVSGVSFTGSTSVGLSIEKLVAGRDVVVQLEMGGKNSSVVLPDADVESAVRAIAVSAFTCSGQWCLGTSKVVVHSSIADQVSERLVGLADQMVVGNGRLETTQMGPLSSLSHRARVQGFVDRASAESAVILTRKRDWLPEQMYGAYISPTVLRGAAHDSEIAKSEVFGPVVSIHPVDDLEQALVVTNSTPYGLTAAIFTGSPAFARRFIEDADVGRVSVNEHSGYTEPQLSLGGRRASGRGEPENGEAARRVFTRHKSVYWSA